MENNNINGHEYVDMGLSVLWATTNFGEDDDFRSAAYSVRDCHITFFHIPAEEKDLRNRINEEIAEKWGNEWRLPTCMELLELSNRCKWKWQGDNGREGYWVAGRGGARLFLPVDRTVDTFATSPSKSPCTHAVYWSGTFKSVNDIWALEFSGEKDEHIVVEHPAMEWNLVRPVADKHGKTIPSVGHASDGHEYVDLGLSVLWATGDLSGGSSWLYPGRYKIVNHIDRLADAFGGRFLTDNCAVGDAIGSWGGAWRLPTRSELAELNESCHWEWQSEKDEEGYRVIGRNGNSIALFTDHAEEFLAACPPSRVRGGYWSGTSAGTGRTHTLKLDGGRNEHIIVEEDSDSYNHVRLVIDRDKI